MGPHGERRSDAKLAAAAGAGEGAAFAALFERYGERIHAFCARLLGSQADAADATQETFLNLLVRLRAGGEPVRDVRAYLFTSARHASLRVLERGRRVDVTDAVPEPVLVGAAGVSGPTEAAALRDEAIDDVRAASLELPVRQREVLALREVEGLSYEEIGAVMELRPNAAAQLAWRGRAGLRSALRRGALVAVVPRTADCRHALTFLELREDGALDAEDAAWLEGHLADCERCLTARATLAEVGVSYAMWAPAAMAATAKLELFRRAGEVVGQDWTSLAGSGGGGPSSNGGGGPSGPGAAASSSRTRRYAIRAGWGIGGLLLLLLVLTVTGGGGATRELIPATQQTARVLPVSGPVGITRAGHVVRRARRRASTHLPGHVGLLALVPVSRAIGTAHRHAAAAHRRVAVVHKRPAGAHHKSSGGGSPTIVQSIPSVSVAVPSSGGGGGDGGGGGVTQSPAATVTTPTQTSTTTIVPTTPSEPPAGPPADTTPTTPTDTTPCDTCTPPPGDNVPPSGGRPRGRRA